MDCNTSAICNYLNRWALGFEVTPKVRRGAENSASRRRIAVALDGARSRGSEKLSRLGEMRQESKRGRLLKKSSQMLIGKLRGLETMPVDS
jgi:hypothetical protein